MMRKLHLIILVFTIICALHANIISPTPESTLNYTQVLFEWEQIPGIESYNLIVQENGLAENVIDINITTLSYLSSFDLDWNSSYIFKICDSNNGSNCTQSYVFYTSDAIDLGGLNVNLYNNYCPEGLTIFGNLSPAFSAAIDCNGNLIWHSGGEDSYIYYNSTKHGELFGGKFYSDHQPGIAFNIDLDISFEEPNTPVIGADGQVITNFIQHELLKTSNGYLGFSPVENWMATPFCNSTPGCENPLPWENGFSDPYAIYRGEKIVLWGSNGDVIWEWSAFDNINPYDYDPILNWVAYPMLTYYDWTHFNALDFEEDENGLSAIYLSSRSLSRIYKIAYPSGEIIWSMGYDWYGNGNVTIALEDENGWYNGFTFQHGIEVLDNGNLLTLDNGNISAYLPYFLKDQGYTSSRTRALEIEIDENSNTANILWSYTLPSNLFGQLSGNVQKLDNENYLATTVGDLGHTLEISPSGEIVWDVQYNLNSTNIGTVYRSHRIKSLFPVNYSLISEDLKAGQIFIDENNYTLDFTLFNEGSEIEKFSYNFNNTNANTIEIAIHPISRPDLGKIFSYNYSSNNGTNLSGLNASGTIVVPSKSSSIISLASNYINGCTNNTACNYNSEANSDDGSCTYASESTDCDGNSLEIISEEIPPLEYIIINAFPNPFNPSITFNIKTNLLSYNKVYIYDVKGDLIDTINDGLMSQGIQTFNWDGSEVSSGIYFIVLKTTNETISKKITLFK